MKTKTSEEKVKCSLCGYTFTPHEAQSACKGCIITKGCRLIRCPNCSYEMPPEPQWLKKFFKGRKNENE